MKNNFYIRFIKKVFFIISVFALVFSTACYNNIDDGKSGYEKDNIDVVETGNYTDKDHVSLYIITYHRLPSNYITKDEAKKMGWDSSKGNLWDVTDKKSIGGDVYRNYEELLPTIQNRIYYECDIDYVGGHRNGKRIIYASDFDMSVGCIYYTDDHYNSFSKLY